MQGVHDHLVQKTPTHGLTYIAEMIPLAQTNWQKCVCVLCALFCYLCSLR
jgi:hypothetical protein